VSADAVTWIGHASTLLDLGGTRILTDPALTPRLGHLRRHVEADADVLAGIDAVLISHVHHDHLHLPSLRRIDRDVPVLVPRGAGRLVSGAGFREVDELVTGDELRLGDLRLTAVPAVHGNRRSPIGRLRAEPLGYVLAHDDRRAYFAGDTDLSGAMRELGPIDVALLPIWGWGPTLGDGHLDPERAATAVEWIDPSVVVPIHWGTYSPMSARRGRPPWLDAPPEDFAARLHAVGLDDRLRRLAPGDTLTR
jgi:L-ascorbate metabolism protein UlaG (beta-lactamase superfamily)